MLEIGSGTLCNVSGHISVAAVTIKFRVKYQKIREFVSIIGFIVLQHIRFWQLSPWPLWISQSAWQVPWLCYAVWHSRKTISKDISLSIQKIIIYPHFREINFVETVDTYIPPSPRRQLRLTEVLTAHGFHHNRPPKARVHTSSMISYAITEHTAFSICTRLIHTEYTMAVSLLRGW